MEKELQEKAAAQLVPSKREAGDGGETSSAEHRDRWGYCQFVGDIIHPCTACVDSILPPRHRREAGDGVETESGSSQPVKDERQVRVENI